MNTLKRDGAVLYYELLGDLSENLVTLVNGHTRSSTDFRLMARGLVESGFSVLLLDNRGAGKTEVHRQFSIQEMYDDVVAIWDELRIAQSNLLGISMGGFISQGISITYPERVKKLVLVSTAPEEKYINPTGGGWISEGEGLEEKMRSYFAPGFVDKNPVLFSTMVKQIRQAMIAGNFTERSDMQRAALKGSKWTSRLSEIKCPTLIIHGAQDLVISVEAAKLIHSNIAGSSIQLIDYAGHLLLAEAPKEFYKLVTEFFLKKF